MSSDAVEDGEAGIEGGEPADKDEITGGRPADKDEIEGGGPADKEETTGGEPADKDGITDDIENAGDIGDSEEDWVSLCICEMKCNVDNINETCTVCAQDYEQCACDVVEDGEAGIEGGGPADKKEPDEGITLYADGNFSDDKGIQYRVLDGNQVQIVGCENTVSGELTIPATVEKDGVTYDVTSIGNYGFYDCRSLTGITLPDSITDIGDWAFYECRSLAGITLPDSITGIGNYTFSGCTGLTGIELPDSIISIGNQAFSGCTKLVDIKLPDRLQSIGTSAFFQCGLVSMVLPDGVQSIGECAFFGCTKLSSVTLPDSVTSIGQQAFYGCYALGSVKLPNGITEIGKEVFYDCRSLTDVDFPSGIQSIGESAFAGCTKLNSVTLPDNLGSIGKQAFYDCTYLGSIELPDSVTSIGEYAFAKCSALTGVKLPENLASISNYVFRECSSLTDIEFPDSITGIGIGVFESCSGLETVTLPDSITSIGASCFKGCSGLTAVTLPGNITGISKSSFQGCSSLTAIEFPNSVTNIEQEAFRGCSSLTDVILPEHIAKIDTNAFYDCGSLESITIPASISSIDAAAFKNCKKLSTLIIVGAEKAAKLPYASSTSFVGCPDERRITFLDADGGALTGEALETVRTAAKAAGDGNTNDSLWWGWKLYNDSTITLAVRKDGKEWKEYGKTLRLSGDGVNFVSDLTAVPDGEYKVYGTAEGEEPVDMGITVTADGTNSAVFIDYFTVTFYDGWIPYGQNTAWKPQIVRAGEKISKPDAPVKDGYEFIGWMTGNQGSTEFDFNLEISNTRSLYAGWKTDTSGGGGGGGDIGDNPVKTHTVTFNVYKDGEEWNAHIEQGKLALSKDDGKTFVHILNKVQEVEEGLYEVYEYDSKMKTGTTVGVYSDTSVTMRYYTVTFYDGDVPYGDNTSQPPQIVLSGRKAFKPYSPTKEGYSFVGWVTADGGLTEFNFDSNIAGTMSIYASWKANEPGTPDEYTIQASAGDGGRISPEGEVKVEKGQDQIFTITPDAGYKIKTVMVDGKEASVDSGQQMEQTRAAAGQYREPAGRDGESGGYTYTFYNVSEDHTIALTFEENGGTGEDDNSGGGGSGSGTGNDDNSGGGGSGSGTGNGDNSGSGGSGSGTVSGDNPGGGGSGNNPAGGSGTEGGVNSGGNISAGGNNGNAGNNNGQDNGGDTAGSGNTGNNTNSGSNTGNIGNNTGSANTNNAANGNADAERGGIGGSDTTAGNTIGSDMTRNTSGSYGTSRGQEPKTGDAFRVEVYATIAMIAGFAYLLLYFADAERGMTASDKDEIVMSLIRWARKGSRLRRYIALGVIFALLVYYHSIGKRVSIEWKLVHEG